MARGWAAEMGRDVLQPKFKPTPHSWNPNTITAAWLGHATVLINFYGVTLLTDPALFPRIGASTVLGTIGPRRLIRPALAPSQLPPVDLVLLSHAHMDHFDFRTLRRIPGSPRAVSSRSTMDLLRSTPLRQPRELGWGDKARIRTAHGEVEIQAFEVNHWGARWKYDHKRGYNGYIIAREGKKIIFGGDTAWSDSFKALRSRGPFELAIMPVGAYDPWIFSHCSPEQAVSMANQAGARHFLPVHFKTFAFGREGVDEPIQRTERAIEPGRLGWRDVGQTFTLN